MSIFYMPQVMGIVNLTPDSFYRHWDLSTALEETARMMEDGADIIDVGGQSTRPGADLLSQEEEWARLMPYLQAVRGKWTVPLSVDTFYPEVARRAVEMGAAIINDVTGLDNLEMARVAADTKAKVVIMHHESASPEQVLSWLRERSLRAMELGVGRGQIIWDPGVGFGKHYEEDLALLRQTDDLCADGFPVLVGASNKRVIGAACEAPLEERVTGSVVAHVAAAALGARIVRVHNVKETVMGLKMAQAIGNGGQHGQNTY